MARAGARIRTRYGTSTYRYILPVPDVDRICIKRLKCEVHGNHDDITIVPVRTAEEQTKKKTRPQGFIYVRITAQNFGLKLYYFTFDGGSIVWVLINSFAIDFFIVTIFSLFDIAPETDIQISHRVPTVVQ